MHCTYSDSVLSYIEHWNFSTHRNNDDYKNCRIMCMVPWSECLDYREVQFEQRDKCLLIINTEHSNIHILFGAGLYWRVEKIRFGMILYSMYVGNSCVPYPRFCVHVTMVQGCLTMVLIISHLNCVIGVVHCPINNFLRFLELISVQVTLWILRSAALRWVSSLSLLSIIIDVAEHNKRIECNPSVCRQKGQLRIILFSRRLMLL